MHHDFDSKRFIGAPARTEKSYASFLGSQLDEPNIVILVAERDGEVLGYTYAGVEGNATAQHLFARAGFRRTMIEMTRELDD